MTVSDPRPAHARARRLVLALVSTALAGASGPAVAAAATGHASGSVARAGLTSRAYFNDPRALGDSSNHTRNLVIDRFNGAPAGSFARMVTFNVTDSAISDAMIAAHRRGVNVQVVMANTNCDESAAQDLITELRQDPSASSFIVCAIRSARSAGGQVHQKSLTFSSTGGSSYVTIVGSANATVEGYADQWVDMYQYAGRQDIYTAYNKVFALQKRDQDMPSPYRSFDFNGGRAGAQFYPVDDEHPTSSDDPVHRRLATIPRGDSTHVQVASYAMQGTRGRWLADDLIALERSGASVRVFTGPPAGSDLEDRMRAAGISVTHAFDKACSGVDGTSCNYIHLKLMTATYVRNGTTQYRVWTGSDNWSDAGLDNDEVAQKIGGRAAWKQYVGFLGTLRKAY